jgi:hypothetical protein
MIGKILMSGRRASVVSLVVILCISAAIVVVVNKNESSELLQSSGWNSRPAAGTFEGKGCFQIGSLSDPCMQSKEMVMNGKLLVPSDSSIAYQAGVERLQERTLRDTMSLLQKRINYAKQVRYSWSMILGE